MKIIPRILRMLRQVAGALVLLGFTPAVASAGGTNVNIVDFAFTPANVVIHPKDVVTWTWVGNIAHSSTSVDTNLWNSGVLTHGSTFSHTFNSSGSFPYFCQVHPLSMKGSVTVQAPAQTNAPPSCAISTPPDGAVFAAPWTGTITAASSDTDGSVAKLDFFAGQTLLGTITSPAANGSLTVSNLAAGSYALTVVATDNGGASATSTTVNITVAVPAPITLTSLIRSSTSSFQFSYSATAGLKYQVEGSTDLIHWSALATNTASSSSETFTDTSANGSAGFYRVVLAPNP